jgi:hypothetical protein
MVQEVVLTIKLLPDGSININGPIADKVLCYGMLEAAKDAVREYVAASRSRIIPAKTLPGGN